jgi:hypothetical protein
VRPEDKDKSISQENSKDPSSEKTLKEEKLSKSKSRSEIKVPPFQPNLFQFEYSYDPNLTYLISPSCF